jgi:3-carboxy-cis,cis-muconate cycloisomerase
MRAAAKRKGKGPRIAAPDPRDHKHVTGTSRSGLFGALFARGAADASDAAWLQAMLDTEAALARAVERAGLAPPGSGAAVTAVARADFFDNGTLGEAATATGNPVPALVRALTARLPESAAGAAAAVHQGATSQDIIDTAAMLIARQALDAILADLSVAAGSCAAHAAEHARTVMSGRTLLQQAVPVTFGLVAAGWLTAIDEARQNLHQVRTARLAVQFGGAAGTLASLGDAGPQVTALLGQELGLPVPVLPWHTDRLRIIDLAAALAAACAALGKIARDVTLLAQTEVAEVHEAAEPGRGGSSAMPHKQNPVAAITVLGCTRQAPGLLATLTSAAEQEHQRAAGAWHSEWQPLSALLTLTSSASSWSAELLRELEVDSARMRTNLEAARGLPMTEHIATLLAPAVGILQAHDLMSKASSRSATDNITLTDAIYADEHSAATLTKAGVSRSDIESALRPDSYLGATPEFIRRALSAHTACNAALSPRSDSPPRALFRQLPV